MKYFYLHIIALIWCLLLLAAMTFKVHLERDYPYMDRPIEALDCKLTYFPNTFYLKHHQLGSFLSKDSLFILDQYVHKDSGRVKISRKELKNIQLSFSFIHQARNSQGLYTPWRAANEEGILIGRRIPLTIRNVSTQQVFGPFSASSQPPYEFEFLWGFDHIVQTLGSGIFAIELHVKDADIPFHHKERVAELFSPKFYPSYTFYIEIPAYSEKIINEKVRNE